MNEGRFIRAFDEKMITIDLEYAESTLDSSSAYAIGEAMHFEILVLLSLGHKCLTMIEPRSVSLD